MRASVDNFRSISMFLLTNWLILMLFQSLNLVVFGKVTIPTTWVIYCILIASFLLFIDFKTKFKSLVFKYGYIIYFFNLVVFNLAIINAWYAKIPLINRSEHLVGALIGTLMTYELLKMVGFLKDIPNKFHLILVAVVANTFAVFHEIFELVLDYFFGTKSIGPEIWDTNLDMLMNIAGILVFVIGYKFIRLKK